MSLPSLLRTVVRPRPARLILCGVLCVLFSGCIVVDGHVRPCGWDVPIRAAITIPWRIRVHHRHHHFRSCSVSRAAEAVHCSYTSGSSSRAPGSASSAPGSAPWQDGVVLVSSAAGAVR